MSVVIAITELREQLREHGKNLRLRSLSWRITSLRGKRFRGVGKQRKLEERDFRHFARAKNGARAPFFTRTKPRFSVFLAPNPTEALATQASVLSKSVANKPRHHLCDTDVARATGFRS